MRTSLFSQLCLTMVFFGASEACAQTTLYNRTPHDLWVAVGYHKASGQQFSTDDFHPGSIQTKGWFKINRFGGSVNVPFSLSPRYGTTFLYVLGSGNRTLERYGTGSLVLPIKRPDGFNFNWSYPYGNGQSPWQNGALQTQVRQRNMGVARFAPMRQFGTTNQIELTLENLGWPN